MLQNTYLYENRMFTKWMQHHFRVGKEKAKKGNSVTLIKKDLINPRVWGSAWGWALLKVGPNQWELIFQFVFTLQLNYDPSKNLRLIWVFVKTKFFS